MKTSYRPAYSSIEDLVPYSAGKPIEEVAREMGLSRIVKLASNENPLGMSPLALEAIKSAARGVNRYPDGAAWDLKEKLSAKLEVPRENIVLGNGSNEILELLAQLFLTEGTETVYAWPAFVVYRLATLAHGGRGVEVPLDSGLRHDLDAMAEALTDRTRIVFVANPNNPTGTRVGRDELERFMDRVPESVPFVLDEAYYEFARHLDDFPDGMQYFRDGRPIVVVRTFSKAHGLAGLRIGYAVMPRPLADLINRVRQPFNVNSIAQAAAIAALEDEDFVVRSLEHNRRELARIQQAAEGMGLSVTESFTNFILIDLKGRSGQEVYEELMKRGVIVRPMAPYGLPGTIRVTAGLVEENEMFLEALKEVIDGE
ncbi:MAG: histidinol-phosphate transaminase [bacterium]|nr:MAG: histidinol-phosphate transaminase [bacterium]